MVIAYSRTTFRGFLSVLRPTYLMWRTWFVSVHARNSKFATRTGFTQTHSLIVVAVKPWPHLPALDSGKFTNGQSLMMSGLSLANSSPRVAGTKPALTRAA